MWTRTVHHSSILLLLGCTGLVLSCPSAPKRDPAPRPTHIPPPIQTVRRVTPKPGTVPPPPTDDTLQHSLIRGQPFTLICDESLKKPPSSLQWYKELEPYRRSKFNKRVTGGTPEAPDLVFEHLANSDAGLFRCHYKIDGKDRLGRFNLITISECTNGFYGERCDAKCGHCKGGVYCATYTGECATGCAPSWRPPYCQQLMNCTYKRYGRLCNYECGECSNNRTCNYSTGYCDKGCAKGWLPPLCQVQGGVGSNLDAQKVALTIGIGAPATLGLIAAVMQIMQCAASGLPCFPSCKKDESDDEHNQDILAAAAAAQSLQLSLLQVPIQPKDQAVSQDTGSPNISSESEDRHTS